MLERRMESNYLKMGVKIEPQQERPRSHFLLLFPAHLEAVERSIIFEGEDVVWDGKEVALGGDQTPDMHGLGCKTDRIRLQGVTRVICDQESNLMEWTRQRKKSQ